MVPEIFAISKPNNKPPRAAIVQMRKIYLRLYTKLPVTETGFSDITRAINMILVRLISLDDQEHYAI